MSDDSFPGDYPIPNDANISFSITHGKRLRISVGGYSSEVRRVSGLPGVDKVLRPAYRTTLSTGQRRFYRKLTEFLNEHRVYVYGVLNCITAMSGATPDVHDIYIKGDRPFPVRISSCAWNIWSETQLSMHEMRSTNAFVYHHPGSEPMSPQDAGEEIGYFGSAAGEHPEPCPECTRRGEEWDGTVKVVVWDRNGTQTVAYAECVTDRPEISGACMDGGEVARVCHAEMPRRYKGTVYMHADTMTLANLAVYAGEEDQLYRKLKGIAGSRRELLSYVAYDGRDEPEDAVDLCCVFPRSSARRSPDDLATVPELDGLLMGGITTNPDGRVANAFLSERGVLYPSQTGGPIWIHPPGSRIGGKGHSPTDGGGATNRDDPDAGRARERASRCVTNWAGS